MGKGEFQSVRDWLERDPSEAATRASAQSWPALLPAPGPGPALPSPVSLLWRKRRKFGRNLSRPGRAAGLKAQFGFFEVHVHQE